MERELDEELQFHLDQRRDALLREGATPEVATAGARRALGGSLRLREAAGEVWSLGLLEAIVRDARYALRTLRRAPAFTLSATLTLALAIGASAANFSLVEAVVLRPLPYASPDQLLVNDVNPLSMRGAFATLRRDSTTVDYAAFEARDVNLTGEGPAQRLRGATVSAELFSVLGVRPRLGRVFQSGDDQPGRRRLVIISHGLWQRQFGGDPDIIGRSLTLDERAHAVVAVMPADFALPSVETALWTPLDLDPADIGAYWGRGGLTVLGRLRRGATIDAARAELGAAAPRLRAMFPWRMPDVWGRGASLTPWQDALVGSFRRKVFVLFGAVGLLWLIACVNVANLLLARSAARSHEMAVRAALGAGAARIFRQLLVESLVLAGMGGLAGLAVARFGLATLTVWLPPETPRLAEVSMNPRVLAFGLVLTAATACVFGLAPAWRLARGPGRHGLTGVDRTASPSRTRRRGADWLVAMQIALAVVLVVSANLLIRSLWRLSSVDVGFTVDRLVTAQLTPSASACPDMARCVALYEEVFARARGLPGVTAAAAVSTLPLSGDTPGIASAIEDHPRQPSEPAFVLWQNAVSPDAFATMGIPLLRGRGFTDADRDGAPLVAIIDAETARRFWPDADPIGRRLKPVYGREWRTVIGVVGGVTDYALTGRLSWIDGATYVPYTQSSGRGRAPWPMTLVVRTTGDPAHLTRELPGLVAGVSTHTPVARIQPMARVVDAALAAPRTITWLLTLFAALALGLGAVGIGGVVACTVAERTREIGIRLALGGRPAGILRLTIGHTAVRAALGLAVGLMLSLIGGGVLQTLLFEIDSRDRLSLVATAVIVTIVVLGAAALPARRALRVNPVDALRVE
jgi:predicted permease